MRCRLATPHTTCSNLNNLNTSLDHSSVISISSWCCLLSLVQTRISDDPVSDFRIRMAYRESEHVRREVWRLYLCMWSSMSPRQEVRRRVPLLHVALFSLIDNLIKSKIVPVVLISVLLSYFKSESPDCVSKSAPRIGWSFGYYHARKLHVWAS